MVGYISLSDEYIINLLDTGFKSLKLEIVVDKSLRQHRYLTHIYYFEMRVIR